MKLNNKINIESLWVEYENTGPVIFIPVADSNFVYKFRVERRIEGEDLQSYGIIQVAKNDEEIRRFSLSKSRMKFR